MGHEYQPIYGEVGNQSSDSLSSPSFPLIPLTSEGAKQRFPYYVISQTEGVVPKAEEAEPKFPENFSDEAKELLKAKGYTISYIKAKSLKDVDEDRGLSGAVRDIFFISAINSKPEPGEVAYNPGHVFVEEGYDKDYEEQSHIVKEYVKTLLRSDIQGVIDHPAVYAQLKGFNGKPLIGTKFARTSLKAGMLGSILISYDTDKAKAKHGISVYPRWNKYPSLGVVNLVRPA